MVTDYITPAELKATLSIGTTYADADIAGVVTAASRSIEQICERRFYLDDDANQVRYYSPDDQQTLQIDDLAVLTSLQDDPNGNGTYSDLWVLNSDFTLYPLNPASDPADVWPYTRIDVHPLGQFVFQTAYPRSVKVTGQFGWPQVPSAIVTATTVLAARLLTVSRSAPMGIVAFEGGAVRLAQSDPTVMGLVGKYVSHRVGIA